MYGKKHGQMSDSIRTAVFIIFSGGFQDAYTYCCRGGVFANAQTGNIVLLSAAIFRHDGVSAVKYLIPVLSFVMGTALAEMIHIKFKDHEKIHWRQIILCCEICLLLAVGFVGDGFEPFANAMVSLVCAMQVQTFHKLRGHAYASTMCIGNLRSGTEAMCAYFRTGDNEALRSVATYFGVIIVFGIGAGVGSMVTALFGFKAIWVCCCSLAVSFFIMFIPEEK